MKSLIGLLDRLGITSSRATASQSIHTATEARTLRMIPADQIPPATSDITIHEKIAIEESKQTEFLIMKLAYFPTVEILTK